ncbi:hypothetical protein BJX76DRAFT_354726 [Aspergillus varians]
MAKSSILVVGFGGIGTITAYNLEASGLATVTGVLRSNYRIAREKGIRIVSVDYGEIPSWRPTHISRHIPSVSNEDLGTWFDFIVVCTKNTPDIPPTVADLIAPAVTPRHTAIVLIQNGINIEKPITARFPYNVVISGIARMSVLELSHGVVHHQGHDHLIAGAFRNPNIPIEEERAAAIKFCNLYKEHGKATAEHHIVLIRGHELPKTTAADKESMNHGINWTIVETAFDALEEFFSLPLESKLKIHQSASPSYMGYEEPYYSNIDGLSKGDSKESVYVSYDPYLDPLGRTPPKFRAAVETYRAACLDLARKIIRVLALAMGVKESFFEKKTTYPIATVRAIHYPPQEGSVKEEIGLGAHTDIQMMTMIAQKPYSAECLEVLNAAGQWVKPKLEAETFVVNLGDMTGRLTNDIFQSTIHRVRNKTPEGKPSQSRYSMPFFFGMNNDELITTLPRFVTEENPLKQNYRRGITGYEHYHQRLQRAHQKHPSAINTTSTALPPGMTKVDGVIVNHM